MATLRQAAQKALEALERADKISGYPNNAAAITALRRSLEAERKAEPGGEASAMPGTLAFTVACFHTDSIPTGTKLYTHPQPAQHPLTDDRLFDVFESDGDAWWQVNFRQFSAIARAIEREHRIE
jgi:hypothetical protein